MYKNEFVFPASNTISEMSHFVIYRAVADHLFTKFPIDQFKTIILDFKNNTKDIFSNQNGRLVNIKEPKTLEYPLVHIEFTNSGNNLKDTHMGHNVPAPMTILAGAEGLNGEKRGATAFYADKNNIQMFSSDIYTRTTFTANLYVQTFDDRNNLANILDTNLKQHYGYELDPTEVRFFFPNSLIKYLRECLFSKELELLKSNENTISKEELEKIALDIDTRFVDYFRGFSNGLIDIHDKDLTKNLRLYYKRWQKPFYKLDGEISLSEGEKKGEVYDKYSISFSGYIEYYNLINFILSMPSIINGEWTKNYIPVNQFPDENNNYKIKKSNTFFVDSRENYKKYLRSADKGFTELFEDVEFLCDNGSDTYPFIEKLIEKYNKNINDSILAYDYSITHDSFDYYSFVNYIKNLSLSEQDCYEFYKLDKILFIIPYLIEEKYDLNKYFKLFIWKNDIIIDETDQEFNNKNLNIEIKNTDSISVYSLLVMVNMSNIDLEFNKLTIYNY